MEKEKETIKKTSKKSSEISKKTLEKDAKKSSNSKSIVKKVAKKSKADDEVKVAKVNKNNVSNDSGKSLKNDKNSLKDDKVVKDTKSKSLKKDKKELLKKDNSKENNIRKVIKEGQESLESNNMKTVKKSKTSIKNVLNENDSLNSDVEKKKRISKKESLDDSKVLSTIKSKKTASTDKTKNKKTPEKSKKDNRGAKVSSILADVTDVDLDKTGVITTIEDGDFFSELLNNKFITIEKIDKSDKKDKKKKNRKKKNISEWNGKFNLDILDVLIIVVITAIISCVFTGIILNYQYKRNGNHVYNDLVQDENVNNFLSLYSEIINNYYEEVDAAAMMKAAMSGMLSFLQDTYSIYLNEDETDGLNEMLDSSYEGIGIVVQSNVIVSIYKNSPAYNAGLEVNDVIININGTEVNNENYMNISSFLSKDEDNAIIVKRGEEQLTFNVMMAKVDIPTTDSTVIKKNEKNIGHIKLTSFSTKSFEDFQESLMDVEKEGIDSLIVDLRGNSGGYLKASYDIASLFIEKDKVIYSLEQKNKVTAYKDETKEKREYKIVVLINNSTASAAEILAAALHDSYGATIVGKTSYGKGKVQTLKQYDKSLVKYTSAKWLRPAGDCIDGIGIVPDYEVDIEFDNQNIYDKQLDKAIELLS